MAADRKNPRTDSTPNPLLPRRLLLIFSILSALLVASMFHRVSNAVIAPNLTRDLGLDAESLGFLGGAYFYTFALLQIPLGPMLDRIGPRIVVTVLGLVGAFGSLLFAYSPSYPVALLGRVLIGAGMGCVLMGSLKVFVVRFPPELFATLMGSIVSIGTLGNVLAASPLAYLTSLIGWRKTFFLAGLVTAALALLVYWVLGKGGEGGQPSPSAPAELPIPVLSSIRRILRSLSFWEMGAVSFFRYGTFISLSGLWLGPYLMDARNYSPIQAGNLLMVLALGYILGGPVAGRLSDRSFYSGKAVALAGMVLYSVTLIPLIGIVTVETPFAFGLLFFGMGFFNSFGVIVLSHGKGLYPAAMSGTVMTGINFFTMAGGAVLMPALGRVIKSFPPAGSSYPVEAYRLCFLICFLGMVVSLVLYGLSERDASKKGEKADG